MIFQSDFEKLWAFFDLQYLSKRCKHTHFVVQSCYVNSKDMEEAEYLLNALSDVRSYFFDKLKDLVSIFKYTLITRSLCWSTLFSRNSLTNKYEGRPPAWGCLRLRFLRFW